MFISFPDIRNGTSFDVDDVHNATARLNADRSRVSYSAHQNEASNDASQNIIYE